MTDIKSGDRVTVMTEKTNFDAYALEDFATDEDREVQVRGIKADDGIGAVRPINPSVVKVEPSNHVDETEE